MTQKQINMIKELEGNVTKVIGAAKSKKIMLGLSSLEPSTNKVKLAEYVKNAIDQLDANAGEKERIEIMEMCGKNCAKINHRAIEMFKKRYSKHPNLDAFLEAEEKDPMKGTKIKRDGEAIIHIYTPQDFTHSMRCFCGLVNGLPTDQTMSITYCHCSKALVKEMWETATRKTLNVEVLQTALSGAIECHFKITF
jgi:hypothetical protein